MPLTKAAVPYTGPYALASNTQGHPSKGPTCEAMKRALSRAGAPSLPWTDFDQHYNKNTEEAWDWYDRKVGGGTNNNGYGNGRWERLRSMKARADGPHAGEWALDAYGRKLIQDEYAEDHTPPPEPEIDPLIKFQGFLSAFIVAAIANEPNWHYSQSRPVSLNINPAASRVVSDCSGFVIQAADYARRKANLVGVVQDPSKQNWTGYGNTDLYEDDWPRVWSPYRVGDLAHYANSRHVTICFKSGDRSTSLWGSHGSERGPESVRLSTYRVHDLMYVVRPLYIPDPV